MRRLPFLTCLLFIFCCSPSYELQKAEDQYFEIGKPFAATHILVAYQGASQSSPDQQRTKEEALAKAQDLVAQLEKDPQQFDQLAREHSDGPSAKRGGYLGSWNKGDMVAEFQQAVENMEIGAISATPVETPFGFHIIRRDPTKSRHYGADLFVVAFKGSDQTPATIRRSKMEAQAIANDIAQKINPGNFNKLAAKHNDLAKGAMAGEVMTERDELPFDVVDVLGSLEFGAVSGPVELPMGFAFFKRTRVEQLAGSHILIRFQGVSGADTEVVRSKDEALKLAQDTLAEIQQDPALFDESAKKHSEGPSPLGVWFRGRMVRAFDEAVSELQPGQISPKPVETPFGFHIIRRDAIPSQQETSP